MQKMFNITWAEEHEKTYPTAVARIDTALYNTSCENMVW
jgi:hypothetical protein